MLVKNWMSTPVITINEKDSMQDAMRLMKEHHIRRLPVMQQGRMVGILTDRDLKRASASDATALEIHELIYLLSEIKIKDIMTKNPITVPVDFTVEETAEILLKNKISGVPVVERGGILVGTITQTDLFKVMMALTGIGKRGMQFAFRLEDRSGTIKEVCDILRKYGARIVSILTTYERVPEGFRDVYIRVYEPDRSKMPKLKEALREKSRLLYMLDHLENRREIYV